MRLPLARPDSGHFSGHLSPTTSRSPPPPPYSNTTTATTTTPSSPTSSPPRPHRGSATTLNHHHLHLVTATFRHHCHPPSPHLSPPRHLVTNVTSPPLRIHHNRHTTAAQPPANTNTTISLLYFRVWMVL
ncbi:hypothetical protein Tco_0107042 [Tanacetum coccineum]